MFERIKALLERWEELKEISNLSERDFDDLGMSRGQIEAFIRMPKDVPDRVAAMAQIFGLTEAQIKADHDSYTDLLYTCGHCRDRGACSLVLQRGDLSRPEDAEFCLNRHSFAAVTAS